MKKILLISLFASTFFTFAASGMDQPSHADDQGEDGNTALHLAASEGSIKELKALLACNDINVNARNKYKETPLHAAVEGRKLENLRLLLEQPGIRVNLRDKEGHTPLDIAIMIANDSVKLLGALAKVDVVVDRKELYENDEFVIILRAHGAEAGGKCIIF